jgi:hypothetical protein
MADRPIGSYRLLQQNRPKADMQKLVQMSASKGKAVIAKPIGVRDL